MAGVKGRSGRKKVTVNSNNGKARLDALLPEALTNIEVAVQGTVECPQCGHKTGGDGDVLLSKWVAEMRLGKPRQAVGMEAEV
ncbi:unnamed protein product, partial [marine sediment metagenome]